MQTLLEHPTENTAPRRAERRAERRPRRRGRVALLAAGGVAVLLVVAQLVLPSLAASRIKHRLDERGSVSSVKVSAFPAVKLLWGHADDVEVRMDAFRAPAGTPGGGVGDALDRVGAVGRLDLSVGTLQAGPVTLRDLQITKHGRDLDAIATLPSPVLRRALPPGFDVRPIAGPDGTLQLKGTAQLLGLRARATARLLAQDGRIVVEPQGGLLAAVGPMTVFDDDRLDVTSLQARDGSGGFTFHAAGRLVG
jgi:hypothetical protein